MKKKLLVLLLVASLAILAFAICTSAATTTQISGSELTATLDGTVLTISGTGSIPDTYRIRDTSITEVIVGEGVTRISGSMCYGLTNLTKVELPSSLVRIEAQAFRGTSKLATVTFGENSQLAYIGRRAFYQSGITAISCDGATRIESEAFRLSKLVTVDMSMSRMFENAFAYCTSLQSVNISGTISELPYAAFYGCSALKTVTLGNSITAIGDQSFRATTNLTTVNLPSDLASIGQSAFRLSGISTITMPNSVTTLRKRAFYESKIADITCSNNLATIEAEAFGRAYSLRSFDMPDSVTTLGAQAFYNSGNLAEINLSNSLVAIPDFCFVGTGLTSISFGQSTTAIGAGAFKNCASLTSVNYNNVNKLGNYAFENAGFTTVTVPVSITTIGTGAFRWCPNLTTVVFEEGATKVGATMFNACPELTDVQFASTITDIGATAFYQCTKLANVALNDGLLTIGSTAFRGTAIEKIIIPVGCTTIGTSAFRDTNISEAFIPATVTSIASNAFNNSSAGRVTIRTEEDASYVITFANSNGSVTLGDYYVPGQEEHVCSFGAWTETTAPTVAATGLLTRTCECGASETFELPALNKTDYTYAVATAPTCTVAGTATYTITKDGQNFVYSVEIAATGDHTYGDYVLTTPATPFADGVETATCTCGATVTRPVAYTGQAVALDVVVNGTTATATLKLVGAPNLTALGFSVTYTANELTATAATTALTGYTTDPALNNPIKFVWNNGLENVNVNGDILTITFTVAEGATITAEDFAVSYEEGFNIYLDGETLVDVELDTFVRVA